ncbi:MAG: 1-aminocyclopropane-1-carboxylate deaminase/D-cysteine desulfhydrase [Chitinophagales bacterium]
MQALLFESITIDEIDLPLLKEKNMRLAVLRLDKIHPVISGNKWFKLKYYLQKAKEEGKEQIATFGGAYSNHIIATAAAGKLLGYKTLGIIRGERPETLSHTLLQAIDYGMGLIFVSREDYRDKTLPLEIQSKKSRICLINEGGYGKDGANGAAEILNFCQKENYSHFACAAGTSTMMAGLIKASLQHQEVIGISVLKNNKNLEKDLCDLLSTEDQEKIHRVIHQYHFGGYAKYSRELINFMNEFYKNTLIPLDFVYTSKLFYGIIDMIKNNSFSKGSNVLLIHSGGLQGNLSLPKGTLIF